jgi:hypothetical protein
MATLTQGDPHPGSRRLDPNALHQSSIDAPDERTVYGTAPVSSGHQHPGARELQNILQQKGVRVA